MKISIVDDDSRVLEKTKALIENYTEKNGLAACCEGFDAPEAILEGYGKSAPQIIFMDVYFGGDHMTGIEASRKIREMDQRAMIVFLTDSAEHMPDAFSVHAFSYIVKQDMEDKLEQVLDDAVAMLPQPKLLTFMHRRQSVSLQADTIISAQTAGHYIELQDVQGNLWRPRMTFTELTEKLKDMQEFLQINKGILVNMEHISGFEDNSVIMIDGSRLPVRVRGYAGIVRQWHEYNFEKIRSEGEA